MTVIEDPEVVILDDSISGLDVIRTTLKKIPTEIMNHKRHDHVAT